MFWKLVIGYVQRQMPAYYAQELCGGIKKLPDDPSKFKRTSTFLNGGEFFPLEVDSGLGFSVAIVKSLHYEGGYLIQAPLLYDYVVEHFKFVQELCEATTGQLAGLKRQLESGLSHHNQCTKI